MWRVKCRHRNGDVLEAELKGTLVDILLFEHDASKRGYITCEHREVKSNG